jgi:hypothetical protein
LSTEVSEVRTASIIRHALLAAVRPSEPTVDNYFTRQYNPEGNPELHTRRRENFKSQLEVHVMMTEHLQKETP